MFLHGSTNLNITTIRMISMVNVPKKIGLKKDESGSDVIVLQRLPEKIWIHTSR